MKDFYERNKEAHVIQETVKTGGSSVSNMEKLLKQIVKFGFVGGTAFVIDAGILMILSKYMGVNYMIANVISFTISVIYNYILSMILVFDVKEDISKKKGLISFIILSIIGLGINEIIMKICVSIWMIPILVSKIIATAIVMVYNFISRKILLEK